MTRAPHMAYYRARAIAAQLLDVARRQPAVEDPLFQVFLLRQLPNGREVCVSLDYAVRASRSKEQLSSVVRAVVRDTDPDYVLLVFESWDIVVTSPEERHAVDEWLREHGDLSEYPGRRESVHASLESCDGHAWTWRYDPSDGPETPPEEATTTTRALAGSRFGDWWNTGAAPSP